MKTQYPKLIEGILLMGVAILMPIKPLLLTVTALIFLDLISGVWAAIKLKKAITSAGFSRTPAKLFVYLGGIIAGFLIERYLLGGTIPLSHMVAGACGLTEMKSLLENGEVITGANLFKLIIDKLSSSGS